MILPVNKRTGKVDLSELCLTTPATIAENEFHDFIAEFNKAGERLTPHSLHCGSKSFKEYIQSLDDVYSKEPVSIELPGKTYFEQGNS
ncbi:hypothetical protein [Desulfopila sp. IMCC35008]|uniref:hypothetical protein n=1 Tax=Desulfopila sp. IMCC35008 TaxID=2653858 RepID=UPI0013D617E3|nr:hypothetical protein [Desulfopila sp. IMCC35008]